MKELFIKGGPIMWPLLMVSIVTITVVVERIWFVMRRKRVRKPEDVETILALVERGEVEEATKLGEKSLDFIARVLGYGLANREVSLTQAILRASSLELREFNRGISILDTVVTLAPLLGLLGTITGMIGSFGLLGASELDSPTVITGGIAEALIATAFGLIIAIIALIPFNYLNSLLEITREDLEEASTQLELLVLGLFSSNITGTPPNSGARLALAKKGL
jgi:biopolymer transport protein ExbB